MTHRRIDDFVVGLVVLLVAGAAVAAALWVKQADVGRRQRELTVRVRDVGGAQLGTPVVIRGVRAGRIEHMTLVDAGWVELRLSLRPEVQLPARPAVILNEASLFGEWQATVLGRDAVPKDPEIQRQIAEAAAAGGEVPGATLPDIAKLTTVAGRIAGDVAEVAERVELAFDDEAARELRGSIRDVAGLSSELSRTVRLQSRNLDTLARDLRRGVGAMQDAAVTVSRVAQRVDSTVPRAALAGIVVDMGAAAAQLRIASARLDSMSGRLARSQVTLESLVARGDSVLAKVNTGRGSAGLLLNDSSLYRNTDSLVRQLNQLARDVQANPGRYVRIRIF